MLAKSATAKKTETQSSVVEVSDSPLLDTLNAAVKKMIVEGKTRGYVTYDELNKALPPEQVSSEQIEDTMSMLSEMGINVVENEDSDEATQSKAGADESGERQQNSNTAQPDLGRTDDPVRMYLREMGSVELLSREGEIAIAKRIEAGREMMIGGICESPLTIRSIVNWHEALIAEEMQLRDIIDLDATHGIGPGQSNSQNQQVEDGVYTPEETPVEIVKKPEQEKISRPPSIQVPNGAHRDEDRDEDEDEDEDDAEQNLPLAQLEAKLAPEVLELFSKITSIYKKLHKLEIIRLEAIHKGDDIKPAQEKRYSKLRQDSVVLIEDVSLNNIRIEFLIEQLYSLNRSLITAEGKLLRMATNSKIKREDFLEHYRGSELGPNWLKTITKLPGKGWERFSTRYGNDA